jgi:arabinose-5-phosphate isomerase
MMAVGDALALLVSRMRDFRAEDFALYHPGGTLGRRLAYVDDLMRTNGRLRVARENLTVREVFVALAGPRRRSGAVLIVDESGRLVGIFTDSDLARLFEHRRDDLLDRPIGEVMTPDPVQIPAGSSVGEAVEAMKSRKISELPVVDRGGHPVGLIDLTDLIGLVPTEIEE